jgi:hypothetical protein
VVTDSVAEGHSPAKVTTRLITQSTEDQHKGERSRDDSADKISEGAAGKQDEQCTTDYIESDEKQGGTTSINVKDLGGDLEEKNVADIRKGDKDQSARQLIRNDTEVFAQNSMEDWGVMKKISCMEQSVEDLIINVGDSLLVNLNEKMTKAEHVACKKPCNTNVANGSNGSQEEVVFSRQTIQDKECSLVYPIHPPLNMGITLSMRIPRLQMRRLQRLWARYVRGEEKLGITWLVVFMKLKGK